MKFTPDLRDTDNPALNFGRLKVSVRVVVRVPGRVRATLKLPYPLPLIRNQSPQAKARNAHRLSSCRGARLFGGARRRN